MDRRRRRPSGHKGAPRKLESRTRWTAGRGRSILLVALILATVIPLVALAWQAIALSGSHRETVEGVLRDYARTGAIEFRRRVQNAFEFRIIYPGFRSLQYAIGRDPLADLPKRSSLDPTKDAELTDLEACLRAFFRLEAGKKMVEVLEGGYDDAERTWLAETLRAHATNEKPRATAPTTVVTRRDGELRTFVYGTMYDDAGAQKLSWGFDLNTDALRTLFDRLHASSPVLPQPFASRIGVDDVAVVVSGPDGRAFYRSSRIMPELSAIETFEQRLSGLTVEAAVRPEAAEALVVGGLPRTRVTGIAALVGASLVLIGAAFFLIRRELQLSRTRTEFVANASHELRTPLAQIRLFAETLLLGRVRNREEARRSLEIIDQEARRLTHRVENVLQFSRSERGATRLAPESRALDELIEETLTGFRPLARARRVDVRLEVMDRPIAAVDTDGFQRILVNLLDNAVKYGPEGQTVTVSVGRSNGTARVCVDDEGPDIARGETNRIWSRYYRGRNAARDAVDGTGIGLWVVRELVELHGGRTWVRNRPGGGARFGVDLPARSGRE